MHYSACKTSLASYFLLNGVQLLNLNCKAKPGWSPTQIWPLLRGHYHSDTPVFFKLVDFNAISISCYSWRVMSCFINSVFSNLTSFFPRNCTTTCNYIFLQLVIKCLSSLSECNLHEDKGHAYFVPYCQRNVPVHNCVSVLWYSSTIDWIHWKIQKIYVINCTYSSVLTHLLFPTI